MNNTQEFFLGRNPSGRKKHRKLSNISDEYNNFSTPTKGDFQLPSTQLGKNLVY